MQFNAEMDGVKRKRGAGHASLQLEAWCVNGPACWAGAGPRGPRPGRSTHGHLLQPQGHAHMQCSCGVTTGARNFAGQLSLCPACSPGGSCRPLPYGHLLLPLLLAGCTRSGLSGWPALPVLQRPPPLAPSWPAALASPTPPSPSPSASCARGCPCSQVGGRGATLPWGACSVWPARVGQLCTWLMRTLCWAACRAGCVARAAVGR